MQDNVKTYEKGRKCRHCGMPIADQTHAATQFCERKQLEDGSVKSCKDDYYIARRAEAEKPYRELAAFHKLTTEAIEALLQAKGPVVTMEQLGQYGIDLSRPVAFRVDEKQPRFVFLFHHIEKLENDTFKITEDVYVCK